MKCANVRGETDTYRDKDRIEDYPDNVESPTKTSNAQRCYLDNDKVRYPVSLLSATTIQRSNDRPNQLDAVAKAAPFVLIERLLTSVGYSHGTP